MARILVVEDDASVREAISLALESDGHRSAPAATGEDGIDRWRAERPDLILLDVMLPGISGFEVCRQIRQHDQVPIIMLTARTDAVDVVVGLESGADDYVTKPFETSVLLARIRAALRRHTRPAERDVVVVGDLRIDVPGVSVTRGTAPLHLTPTEFKLLVELARRPGQVFSRELLLERVWDYSYLGDSRLVDVCVQRLRAKVEADPAAPTLIQTVRGMGYKLVPPT